MGIDVPHPGVDNSFYRPNLPIGTAPNTIHIDPIAIANGAPDPSNPERKYYPYYQWICFVFFIQAIIFYLPHYMWKMSEGGLMQILSMGKLIQV